MSRTLPDFLDLHCGATAWLFGKGPSLDTFLADRAARNHSGLQPVLCFISDVVAYEPALRAALELHSAFSIPHSALPTYCFANDSIARWVDLYRPGHVLFQPLRTLRDRTMQAPAPDCERIVFEDTPAPDRLRDSPAGLASGGLYATHGTAATAAQILSIMGVAQVVCVGLDGCPGRSAGPWRTPMRSDHATDYRDIHQVFLSTCATLGLSVSFYGPHGAADIPTVKPGYTALRLRTSVRISGRGYSEGSIVEVPLSLATVLIGDRHADLFPSHRAQPMETAALVPALETR